MRSRRQRPTPLPGGALPDAELEWRVPEQWNALERNRAQWQTELETLQRVRPPNAVQLATHWAGLTPAQAHRQTAHRQLEAVTDAFHGWNHSAASWFGLKRGERQAWEQRIQHAEDAAAQAEHDYTAAQQRFHELLPAARDAVQRRAEQRQQQAAALQQRINECEALMNHAARVQFEAHRQHLPQWPSSKPRPPTPRG